MESKATPVQARSRQTRENILAAALSMYEKKGYHSTTVDEIAAQAGVSTGIAYRYFKNKKDILLNAIAYGAENVGSIAGISTSLPEDIGDVRGHITAVLKAFETMGMNVSFLCARLGQLLNLASKSNRYREELRTLEAKLLVAKETMNRLDTEIELIFQEVASAPW